MNWKGFGSKWSRPNFKILSLNSHGGTEENKENEFRISGLRVEI
jgi:hypothetical protein